MIRTQLTRTIFASLQGSIPHFADTSLYYSQFAFSLGKESPFIFFKFNLLNLDTFYSALSVPVNKVWVNLQSSEPVIDK